MCLFRIVVLSSVRQRACWLTCFKIIFKRHQSTTCLSPLAMPTAVMHNITLSMLLSLQRSSVYLVKAWLPRLWHTDLDALIQGAMYCMLVNTVTNRCEKKPYNFKDQAHHMSSSVQWGCLAQKTAELIIFNRKSDQLWNSLANTDLSWYSNSSTVCPDDAFSSVNAEWSQDPVMRRACSSDREDWYGPHSIFSQRLTRTSTNLVNVMSLCDYNEWFWYRKWDCWRSSSGFSSGNFGWCKPNNRLSHSCPTAL